MKSFAMNCSVVALANLSVEGFSEEALAVDQQLMAHNPVQRYDESAEEERHSLSGFSGAHEHYVCLLALSPTQCD